MVVYRLYHKPVYLNENKFSTIRIEKGKKGF